MMSIKRWIEVARRTHCNVTRRFMASTRGNVAMIFALSLPVLMMITMGGVDLNRVSTVRLNLQDALDAAALAAARSPFTTNAELTDIGTKALIANLQAYPDITFTGATFTVNEDNVIIASANVDVKTLVANIVLPPYGQLLDDTLPVRAHSEVNRSSKNIEVALVLDVTGSMGGQRIADLKVASKDLVDIVVQDTQTPFYTRMAIVPYSIGVNLAGSATAARGGTIASTAIQNVSWATGGSKSISDIDKANEARVDANNHGFSNGDYVLIEDVRGMTQINGRIFKVKASSNNSFNLDGFDTRSYSTYTGGGRVTACLNAACQIVIQSNNHGLSATDADNGDPSSVRLSGIGGATQLNNSVFQISAVSTNSFTINRSGSGVDPYTSGGQASCGRNGCPQRIFRDRNSNYREFRLSTCVSERIGSQRYTNASPTSAKVGRVYINPVSNAPASSLCPAQTVMPLTDNRTNLKSLVDSLTTDGATAGHIGLAWGWYAVSSNFNSLFAGPGAGANNPAETLKSVILMTDGEFNTNYCSGVLANNASFGGNDRIRNCNATNGSPYIQAQAICDAMKAQSITIYTVGFQVSSGSSAANILAYCATSPAYAFLPANGSDLSDNFAAIGREITRLRISR